MNKITAPKLVLLLLCICILAFLLYFIQQPADGWHKMEAGTEYILEGKPLTGWQDIDGFRYYFGDTGLLHTAWQQIGAHTYYFGNDGALFTGWLTQNGKQFYLRSDGSLAIGMQVIEEELYHFSPDGSFLTGLVAKDGVTLLYDDHGFLNEGWIFIDGRWYYGNENGIPLTGWQELNGLQHYFTDTGAAADGWLALDGFDHYFYEKGIPAQGERTIDGVVRYFASNGQHLYLVNPWHMLPEGYNVELVSINDRYQIAEIAYADFKDMMDACRADGLKPVVCSAYRTYDYQNDLYQNRIKRYIQVGYSEDTATALAGRSVAIPGTSEHQLGLALDIVDFDYQHLNKTPANMPTQKWLMANSWQYGWILRYPSEKSAITGIIYEPWHYRYVGKTVAAEIHELGICLEEYLDMLTISFG